jgi:hypothetical protein
LSFEQCHRLCRRVCRSLEICFGSVECRGSPGVIECFRSYGRVEALHATCFQRNGFVRQNRGLFRIGGQTFVIVSNGLAVFLNRLFGIVGFARQVGGRE